MNTETIIQAQNLAAGYAGKSVWKQADFSIAKGDFVGVLGPNGAGKTTLFRLLLGLIQPISGELSIFGHRPKRGNPRIGYVPQRHSVDSETMIEALEIVRLGLTGNRWGFDSPTEAKSGRDEAFAAIEAVGASALAHRPLGLLSGGEAQRIFLAQALVGNPDILLLDEPLANLDIRRESENGRTHPKHRKITWRHCASHRAQYKSASPRVESRDVCRQRPCRHRESRRRLELTSAIRTLRFSCRSTA